MRNLAIITSLSLTVLLFIVMTPTLNISFNLIYLLFIAGNGVFVYLVYKILKDGKPSPKKFDEGNWYEDTSK
jgi:hypothetical protein